MIGKLLAAVLCIAWALWLGGLAALFLFVTRLFLVDHDMAVKAAPELFKVYEKYQLVLAALTITSAMAIRITRPGKASIALFWILALPTLAAGFGVPLVQRMLHLADQGLSSTPEFMKLHGWSMLMFTAQGVVLLIAGIVLPWAIGTTDQKPLV